MVYDENMIVYTRGTNSYTLKDVVGAAPNVYGIAIELYMGAATTISRAYDIAGDKNLPVSDVLNRYRIDAENTEGSAKNYKLSRFGTEEIKVPITLDTARKTLNMMTAGTIFAKVKFDDTATLAISSYYMGSVIIGMQLLSAAVTSETSSEHDGNYSSLMQITKGSEIRTVYQYENGFKTVIRNTRAASNGSTITALPIVVMFMLRAIITALEEGNTYDSILNYFDNLIAVNPDVGNKKMITNIKNLATKTLYADLTAQPTTAQQWNMLNDAALAALNAESTTTYTNDKTTNNVTETSSTPVDTAVVTKEFSFSLRYAVGSTLPVGKQVGDIVDSSISISLGAEASF